MNFQVVKTKAEEALGAQFEVLSPDLPGGQRVLEERRAAIARFAAEGLPNRRAEQWKYTDLRARYERAFPPSDGHHISASWQAIEQTLDQLANVNCARVVIVDGAYAHELSSLDVIDGHVEFLPLREAFANEPQWLLENLRKSNSPADDATITLNTAFMTDGAIIRVKDGVAVSLPLMIVHVSTSEHERSVYTRNLVVVGDNASLTLIECHTTMGLAATQSNAVTELAVGNDARVSHVKVQGDNLSSQHLGTWMTQLEAGARYRALQITTGGALTRNQLHVMFRGEDASAHINGAFLQRGTQHCDTTMLVEHIERGCESREFFKGVLDDNARGVFQGKIIVKPEAQKTDGKQMTQALLLSETAEFDAKPELEIFAEDVACGHGATSGQIDEDMLFYLRARGLSEEQARLFLIKAFVSEVLDVVEEGPIREALEGVAEHWLRSA